MRDLDDAIEQQMMTIIDRAEVKQCVMAVMFMFNRLQHIQTSKTFHYSPKDLDLLYFIGTFALNPRLRINHLHRF